MKVIILPGKDDEGGPPTIKEIEQIENRYQLQAEGKAEYYGFDAALSIRDKELSGYTLDQQMRDERLRHQARRMNQISRAIPASPCQTHAQLKQLLRAEGQREPGIITADGFLINGNRRKVALDELRSDHSAEDAFQTMKVIILPGKDDEGGPPTIKEIEQIENRYQLQAEGKAEYYGFDAALSIRDKELSGYTLDQQMRDDPQYKLMDPVEFQRAVRKRRKELLEPLECVEEYLEAIGRPGEYWAVSRGLGDPEGRWQAFIDLSQAFWTRAKTRPGLDKMGINEKEAGAIMQAAYSTIRLRTVPTFGKLHDIMRELPKYTEHGKAQLLELTRNTKHVLPAAETITDDGEQLSRDAVEEKWKHKYRTEITRRLVQARDASQTGSEKNAPLTLLSDALKKLTHDNMVVENIPTKDLDEALSIANGLCCESDKVKTQIYNQVKTAQKVGMLKSSDRT